MPVAWQKRSMERQRLLEEMQTKIIHLEDEAKDRKWVQTDLIEACIRYLCGKPSLRESDFLYSDLLPSIRDFSRADEETFALVSKLLTWLVESFVHEFHTALQSKEIHDPKTIFHADSAMESIELDQ